jgi:nucleoid-associated protein YgaU
MTFSNDDPNPDFSDASGSSTSSGGAADFSDVTGGSSTTAPAGGKTYIVNSGDSLSKIAKQFYGDAGKWKKIHAANKGKIPNPDLIHPGLQLTIPDA